MSKGTIEWLPIEDAPKDGTIILLNNGDTHVAIWSKHKGGYWKDDGGYCATLKLYPPTHFAYINHP